MGRDLIEHIEQRRAELDREAGRRDGAPSREQAEKGGQERARQKRETMRTWMHRALREIREDPGLSVSILAERLDCSPSWASEVLSRMRERDLVRAEQRQGERGNRLRLFVGEEAER